MLAENRWVAASWKMAALLLLVCGNSPTEAQTASSDTRESTKLRVVLQVPGMT